MHIAMYPCSKFQLIWRTSDFGTKFAQKSINEKNYEKVNIKHLIRNKDKAMYVCTNFPSI